MVIRSAVLALCLVSLCSVNAAAQENTAAADWSSLCLTAHGDPDAVFRRAEQMGWQPLPQGRGRYLQDSGGRHVVMVVDAGTRQCIVSHPAQGNIETAVQTLVGQPPAYHDGGFGVWVADSVGGTLTWLSNNDTQRASDAFTNRRAVLVRAGVDQGLDIVMYEFRAQ